MTSTAVMNSSTEDVTSRLAANACNDHTPVAPQMTATERARARASSEANNTDEAKDPPQLQIRPLPPVDEIRAAIPAEGIDLQDLVQKFAHHIDHTNIRLFFHFVREMGIVEMKVWVKPSLQMPKQARFDEIEREIKTLPIPRQRLESNQTISSKLLEGVSITFKEPEERMRAAVKLLPKLLYRVDYEQSATLSTFTSQHTHVRHRKVKELQLQTNNAFQSIGEFTPQTDFTALRIERHLRWNQKRDPSSYISAFGDLKNAERRAHFLYHDAQGQHIGQRITITVISTAGLVPVTVRGKLQEKIETNASLRRHNGLLRDYESSVEVSTRDVEIPAWIDKKAMPDDKSPITLSQLTESGADVWMSISELRVSSLKLPAHKGHSYEWLAGGVIPTWRVKLVMPFDGTDFHEKQGPDPVRVESNKEPWYFDWNKQMWCLEKDKPKKRKHPAEDANQNSNVPDQGQNKRPRLELDRHENESEAIVHRCPTCKQPIAESSEENEL